MYEPRCPHCQVEIELDDCIDENETEDGLVKKCVGTCPKCKRDFYWEEYYELRYSEYGELKEDVH